MLRKLRAVDWVPDIVGQHRLHIREDFPLMDGFARETQLVAMMSANAASTAASRDSRIAAWMPFTSSGSTD
jgi:hypothetical protein